MFKPMIISGRVTEYIKGKIHTLNPVNPEHSKKIVALGVATPRK
jgi:hypothetical protein